MLVTFLAFSLPFLTSTRALPHTKARATASWEFVKTGQSGVIALESIVVSETLVAFFDNVNPNPLQINNHSAWGALWNLETNEAIPLDLTTNTFCASGALLSNGSMVSVGGSSPVPPAGDGLTSLRIFEPCDDPTGLTCPIFDNPDLLHLAEDRWYTTAIRIFDGSLMIIGGTHVPTAFFNDDPANTFEFFPPKDGGVPRPSPFLERTLPANLFPRAFQLPDGHIFMVSNNQSILYDVETGVELPLPDLPNGVRVTNPFDGTGALLPLSPPDYIPEVLICGGTNISDAIPTSQISTQDPASTQCSRIELTPSGIVAGWQLEQMIEPRMMPEMVIMPNGQILITNGARSGTAALQLAGLKDRADPNGDSNADHPVLTPELYTPTNPLGQRISNEGLPTTDIARMYHSTVTLTPQGNILLAGSNPNVAIVLDAKFPSTYDVEVLNPPFMQMERPVLGDDVPTQLLFGEETEVSVTIPDDLEASDIKVSLMDLGFSSHAWHSSGRLVFLESSLSEDRTRLTLKAPPNGKVFPPAPGWLFLTVDDVTSVAKKVMIGSGRSPPTLE